MKKIFTLFIILFLSLGVKAQFQLQSSFAFMPHYSPKYEVRAVWVTTIGGLDWPHSYASSRNSIEKQKKELTDLLDQYKEAGINTVLLQTRVRATTIYPSKYEPFDGCLSGKPGVSPGYDALAFAIEECHKRGMELHAWVVTIPVGKWNGKGCTALRKKYPKLIKKIGDDGYMNPEDPQTAKVIADICEEITRGYDIDGIHLDYIRYPETWKIKVSAEKGRKFITDIVKSVNQRVKTLKPWVKMSCSPIGKFRDLPQQSSKGWNAYNRVCQDAQGWLRDGLMDELFPMMYFRGDNFYPFALDWKQNDSGKIVVPGLGIYFMSPKEKNWPLVDITQEMEVLRQFGLGHAYFRGKFLTDNTKGIYNFASSEFDVLPALVPPMTWESSALPDAPSSLVVDSVDSKLRWSEGHDNSNGTYLTYNVYGGSEPVDIQSAENLVATRLMQQEVNISLSHHRYYAVTAVDRYGNESKPIYSYDTSVEKADGDSYLQYVEELLPCDGTNLMLSDISMLNKADVLVVESLQGNILATYAKTKTVDVSALPEGIFVIRSLGKKGVTHRLGFFKIERNRP